MSDDPAEALQRLIEAARAVLPTVRAAAVFQVELEFLIADLEDAIAEVEPWIEPRARRAGVITVERLEPYRRHS